jgi:Tfp pilus assembly PilM family ATPase/Tfp pilus assembly protein PilN
MSKAEAFLASAVQIAGPLTRLQERIVAVKLHPDAVSVMQLNPTLDDWKLDRLISWSLDNAIGRQPVQENYPYLSDQIAAAANEAGVDGVDAGISIPASLFDTRTLTLPFMSEAELAEEAEEPEFWEEFDPELSNLVGRVVKFQILYSNENEDRIVVLLSSIGVADLERYRSLMLDANLLPVFIENEIFSLVNGIYARMSSDDIYKPFSIVHLCPGNNLLVSNMRGRLVTQKINISDFDEALLMELESVDEPGGDFWEEVAIRVSEQVKQAIAFVVETYEFPNPDKVFFVSEYKSIDNFVTLIEDRLGTARVIVYDAMEDVDVPNEHAKYLDYFENPSVFTTAVGLATQGINVEGRGASHLHRRLISMNFLQDAPRIRRNRQLGALNRILTLAIMAVLVFSGSVLGINTIPAYLQTREASKQFNQAKSIAQTQKLRRAVSERKLLEANALVSNMQKNTVRRGHAKFLTALPAMLPIGTELQGLTISQTDGVALSGLATSNEQVNEIKRNLRTQGFVNRDPAVDLKREDDYWAFQMTLNLARSE